VASYAITDEKLKQEILEIVDIIKRVEKVLERIKIEISIAKIQKKIANKVKNTVAKEQKEFYLREQLRAIQEELGEDDEDKKEIAKYEEKIKKAKLPNEVKEKVNYELSRLKNMSPTSSEGNVVKAYLDWVLDIPWGKNTKENIDVTKAREVLDNEHYGLE
ncbi:endopeptidase La, partial [Escherichia coli]|nr:endopeptidase La [Escherichia coli]